MIIVLKLTNGETVLGLLALEDDDIFVIQDPFHLELRADAKGYRQLLLYRYNQFSREPHMTFHKEHIIGTYYPDDDLEEYYWYSLDHTIKFRDVNMSTDIQRASQYIQKLIDSENNPDLFSKEDDDIPVSITTSSNTVH